MRTKTITHEEAGLLLFKSKSRHLGRIFTATFNKKDGTERVMNCRFGVKKHLSGGELRYNPSDFGMMSVFDMVSKGYRMLTLNKITRLKIGGEDYEVVAC